MSALLIIQSIALAYATNAKFHINSKLPERVLCSTYPSVVSTNEHTHAKTPYFIQLFRCQGADFHGSPETHVCAPTAQGGKEPINITVPKDDGSLEALIMYNHTRCEYRCLHDARVCTAFQVWKEDTCACECDTSTKQVCDADPLRVWEETSCCVCKEHSRCSSKHMNATTCQCIPAPKCVETGETRGGRRSAGVGVGTVVFVVLLELVLVVGAMLVCDRFRRRGKGSRDSCSGLGMGSGSTLEASPCNGKVFDSDDDNDCVALHS